VRNGEGRVVAAISVTGPLSRLTATRISGLATTLRQAAERVSARMGEPHAS
jgi:DNA-binding IclR family transcriptional regulator